MLKSIPTQLYSLTKSGGSRRNLRVLFRFLAILAGLILVYSILFHFLMLREGQEHTWITGLYWTLTVMSTLGFGDITFHTDLGRAFSILVLLSGMVFLLVLLPFTFIEFFYEPWVKVQTAARTPRSIDPTTTGHVVISSYDEVTAALLRRLEAYSLPYVVVVESTDDALRLQDLGVRVAVGELDHPETYVKVRANAAAMVVATGGDVLNTSVAFTVREVAPSVPIVGTVHSDASVDVLELAGCNHVLRLEEIVGQWFARRVIGGGTSAHVIGNMDGLLVAEASVDRTALVGKTLAESGLRENLGVTVAGVYQRGRFEPAQPETRIGGKTVLMLVGSKDGFARYNAVHGVEQQGSQPVLILGGGRVGRATARAVARGGHDYRIVEREPSRIRDPERHILGDAADLEVLKRAGIDETSSIVITTHDDDMNVYLTLYCRRLRPDTRIIARATDERHVAVLHRAGADYVTSYASTGANTIFSYLRQKQVLMAAEGLYFFRAPVPPSLAGIALADSAIRERTGCTAVAVTVDGTLQVIPSPQQTLTSGGELLLVGTAEAQRSYLSRFAGGV